MNIDVKIEDLIDTKNGNLWLRNVKSILVSGINIVKQNGTLRLIFKSETGVTHKDGEMWLEGTDLKILIGGTTYTITKT